MTLHYFWFIHHPPPHQTQTAWGLLQLQSLHPFSATASSLTWAWHSSAPTFDIILWDHYILVLWYDETLDYDMTFSYHDIWNLRLWHGILILWNHDILDGMLFDIMILWKNLLRHNILILCYEILDYKKYHFDNRVLKNYDKTVCHEIMTRDKRQAFRNSSSTSAF